ncbi:MAG: hypothetical protein AAF984_03510 [Verrucomicrobiota bacterium]
MIQNKKINDGLGWLRKIRRDIAEENHFNSKELGRYYRKQQKLFSDKIRTKSTSGKINKD